MTIVRPALALVSSLLVVAPAHAGPPTAEASVVFTNPTATKLQACVRGNVDDGSTVVGVWQVNAFLVRDNRTTQTFTPAPTMGAVLPLTCVTFTTASATGYGALTASFTGASSAGDVVAECTALLNHTPTAFPHPLLWQCANPVEALTRATP